jgi:hypothetical protein
LAEELQDAYEVGLAHEVTDQPCWHGGFDDAYRTVSAKLSANYARASGKGKSSLVRKRPDCGYGKGGAGKGGAGKGGTEKGGAGLGGAGKDGTEKGVLHVAVHMRRGDVIKGEPEQISRYGAHSMTD